MKTWRHIHDMPELDSHGQKVLLEGATEPPHRGVYDQHFERGVYLCRQCGLPLYRSGDKFHCGCGWPAFDAALPKAVESRPDPDGRRTEIVCSNCGGHLGHAFVGEELTPKNLRHCVNSLSLYFVSTEQACFAGGCFWGTEAFFSDLDGVLVATSGYTGGHIPHPTYREVCGGTTGHAEAVLIDCDPQKTDYQGLVRTFLEIHDPTQLNRQGPDFGTQYRSAVFYFDEDQKTIAREAIDYLRSKGIDAVTEVVPASIFYPAEDYHQKYFQKHPEKGSASCHRRQNRIWE